METKDLVTLGMSAVSLVASGYAVYLTYRRDRRDEAAKSPVLSLSVAPQIVPKLWLLNLQIRNRSDHAVRIAAVDVLAPKRWGLVPHTSSAPLHERPQPRMLNVRDFIAPGEPGGWLGYLRADDETLPDLPHSMMQRWDAKIVVTLQFADEGERAQRRTIRKKLMA